MKPGECVLIRFPQANLQMGKLRPALVLAVAPGAHPDRLLALITSRDYQAVPEFDEVLDPADPDFTATGLKVRSVIRLARLASVEAELIVGRLGQISPARLNRLLSCLSQWLLTSVP